MKPVEAGGSKPDSTASRMNNMMIERRAPNRLATTPCPHCAGLSVRGVVRTAYVVYFRCHGCAHVWVVDRPDVALAGADNIYAFW